jgi:hypothetical protein
MDINRNNYETYFLLYLDGELPLADRLAVEKFLSVHSDLQREFVLLQQTILQPADILFDHKESLLRKEEKRRVIPVYWMRRAAVIALLLAGSWFMATLVLKNHGVETAGSGKANSGKVPLKKNQVASLKEDHEVAKQGPENAAAVTQIKPEMTKENNSPANQNRKKALAENKSLSTRSGQAFNTENLHPLNTTNRNNESKQIVSDPGNTAYGNKTSKQIVSDPGIKDRQDPTGRGNRDLVNDQTDPVSGEFYAAAHKSNTSLEPEIAGSRAGTVPGQTAALTGTQTLALTSEGTSHLAGNDYVNEPDIQTDDAISVLALNDRNKAITGFFKKITRRAPAEATASNTKKLRVSVFQFSY